MAVEIVSTQLHSRGVLHRIRVQGRIVEVLFLTHAMERMKKWNLRQEMVGETLLLPEEVLIGHRNRYVAHKRYGSHLLRAVYEYDGAMPVLLTAYFPYVERYFKGGGAYADKILERC